MLVRTIWVCAGFTVAVFSAAASTGCKSAAVSRDCEAPHPYQRASTSTSQDATSSSIVQAMYEQSANDQPLVSRASANDDPFGGRTELELNLLVAEVLKRNPSVSAIVAAWRAAAERYPQVISLDDPMFGVMLGPATFGSGDVDFGWMVEASQKVPWPGKRHLRGHVALAEAEAAYQEIEDVRLRLAEAAKLAFLDYFLVRRELEVNGDNQRIMEEFRKIAQGKYETNLVTQQDVLQAQVELADLSRRQIDLEQMNEIAIARINTLLHRAPDFPLPPPPQLVDILDILPTAETLRKLAIERRPDLAAQAARIRSEEVAVELACREFYPDLEFVARYDAFWQPAERDLRPQIGVNLNLPIQRDRRRAAVAEAIARVTKRRAEFDQQLDQVQNDVQAGVARLDASRRTVQLYTDSIIPTSRQNVESAQAGYEATKVDFLRLIEAQRRFIGHREKYYEAMADYHRRVAELERILAGPLPPADGPADATKRDREGLRAVVPKS